jgi:hypothetical protein
MKIIYLIISLFLSFQLFGQEFEIIEATSQKWTGGRKETGKGINYEIKILAKKGSAKLNFEKLWIGDDYYKVKAKNTDRNKPDNTFTRNDTIRIIASSLTYTENIDPVIEKELGLKHGKQMENEKPPYKFSGAALIGYRYKGKWKYEVIRTFKELEKLYYP